MNILVVIPARGGSKGIPRKNLRLLGGKPLLYYPINNALKSKYNLDVFVSSEDDEILNAAQKCGAKTHKRDLNISDDKTTLDPVIYDCYIQAKSFEKKEYDLIITMQPTSPLLLTKPLSFEIFFNSFSNLLFAKLLVEEKTSKSININLNLNIFIWLFLRITHIL